MEGVKREEEGGGGVDEGVLGQCWWRGGAAGPLCFIFPESSLKTADTWCRIPLSVGGGGGRKHHTVCDQHTFRTRHSATQKAAEKEDNFEDAGRPTPPHAGTGKPQTLLSPECLSAPWETG